MVKFMANLTVLRAVFISLALNFSYFLVKERKIIQDVTSMDDGEQLATANNNHALDVLKGKWVYLLGDSSLRMFNGALISLINGTLEDPRFGSFTKHDKGGCEGEVKPERSGECLREYFDKKNSIRLTFSFKTLVQQKSMAMENLISPSQQPDFIVLATGAWDKYVDVQTGSEAGDATIRLVNEMLDIYTQTDIIVATLNSCSNQPKGFRPFTRRYNSVLQRQLLPSLLSNNRTHPRRRVHLLDREPSTINVTNKTLCEGWHAYNSVVLGHVDEFLDFVKLSSATT